MSSFSANGTNAPLLWSSALMVIALVAASAAPAPGAATSKQPVRTKPRTTVPARKRVSLSTKTSAQSTTTTVLTSGLPALKNGPVNASVLFLALLQRHWVRDSWKRTPGTDRLAGVLAAVFTLLSLGAGGDTRKELENSLGLDSADQQRVSVAESLAALGSLPAGFDSKEQVVKLANAAGYRKASRSNHPSPQRCGTDWRTGP